MRVIAGTLILLVAAACTPRINTNPNTGGVDVDVEPVTQRGEVWDGTLTPSAGFTGISGTTRATVRSDQTEATITLSGAPSGGTHPWHVHNGKCGSGGSIVGDPAAYPPLRPGSAGDATANAVVSVPLNEAMDYHVNVHASPADLGTIVACADLDD